MRPTSTLPPLEVYMLGLVEFEDIQHVQRRVVYDLGESGSAALILCEHPPTISVGRSGSRADIVADDDALRNMGLRVFYVNRGGGCILHVPRQLSVYVILPLHLLGLSLQEYMDRLHSVIIAVLSEFDLAGTRRPALSGIFSGESRIATVGVAVNRWIAYHGITLNVSPFLEWFELLKEPGIGGLTRHTSMESRRQRQTPMPKVRESMLRQIETTFGLEQHHLFTSHPQIRQKVRAHVYTSSSGR